MNRELDFDREFEVARGVGCSARWRTCEDPRDRPVVLAHGAGAGHASPLLAALEQGLAAARFEVLSFHYPYMTRMLREARRRPPDPMPILEAAHARAIEELDRLRPGRRPLLIGKSMGGR